MAVYIAVPKLGMTMNEATIVSWLVGGGEWAEEHQALLQIETEKVNYTVEARAGGFVHILVEQGQKVRVGRVVGLLAESKEELEALQREPPREMYGSDAEIQPPCAAEAPCRAETAGAEREHVRISPVARKMAEEHAIDITRVSGSGPGGRIVREDIEKAIEARKQGTETPRTEVYAGHRVKATIPLKGMRAAIAEHMHRSLSVAAQLTTMGEIDATELIKLRNTLLEQEKSLGTRISYTDIFVFIVARALKDNPIINSSLMENEIKVWEDINVAVAVALEAGLEGGLIVPVVRNADRKPLPEISREVKSLVDKARAGKLMPDDVSGGTFTITNLGTVGGGWSFLTPIINQPQSAILGTGAITERAVVRRGQVVARPVMTYSFTYDHRVIDGAPAERFMVQVTRLLENPMLLFV
ncbi:MAG: 2-oxo acid dehydrogenase subunit E2 [Dehalococcoidia bacterium]|nr:2-oxo acid dehydrogenase subunit E2 [Dehalococcoidia bacterium]